MEQVRIIKEMRDEDRKNKLRLRGADEHHGLSDAELDIRPRFCIWENVEGSLNSNGGDDFRAVLEEMARVVEETVTIPRPTENKGRWTPSGVICGDGWSIAWRLFDAQHWGVPQRRKRICLVADFNGYAAADIVFEHGGVSYAAYKEPIVRNPRLSGLDKIRSLFKGLSRHPEQSESQREEVAKAVGDGSSASDSSFCIQGSGSTSQSAHGSGVNHDVAFSLNATDVHGVAYTMQDREGKAGGGKGFLLQEERSASIRCANSQTLFQPEEEGYSWDGSQCRTTLTSSNADGRQRMPDKENFNCVITRAYESHPNDSRIKVADSDGETSLSARIGTGGGNSPLIIAQAFRKMAHPKNETEPQNWEEAVVSDALNTFDASETRTPTVVVENEVVAMDRASFNQGKNAKYDMSIANDGLRQPIVARGPGAVAYCIGNGQLHDALAPDREVSKTIKCLADPMKVLTYQETVGSLCADDYKGVNNQLVAQDKLLVLENGASNNIKSNNVIRHHYRVRRLTPLECERLQGFPSGWTDIGDWVDSKGKLHKGEKTDAARYKALGNSIALPQWRFVLDRMHTVMGRNGTMASLFDGIGGFPLCWEDINGKGTALWASEIEEFPIAVTKLRFGEEKQNESIQEHNNQLLD